MVALVVLVESGSQRLCWLSVFVLVAGCQWLHWLCWLSVVAVVVLVVSGCAGCQ